MERLSQQALKDTDILWRSILSDGNDVVAQNFLSGSGKTFVNELGNVQSLFTTTGNQLFRPEMFADSADPVFYKQFVQSGVSRELSTGLIKELKNSGIELKDGAINLYQAAKDNPAAVLTGLLKGVEGIPAGVRDSFIESGKAIGEGAAVALNSDLIDKLNSIYGQDVSYAQNTLLAVRIFAAVIGAKTVAEVADALASKAAGAIVKDSEKPPVKNSNPDSSKTDGEFAPLRASNGVELDPRLPEPVAGLDYSPKVLDSENPNIANSHINGYVAELELANQIAALPDEIVLKYGDVIGRNGSDVISVNQKTGEVTLWDSKYRSNDVKISESPTFTIPRALENALQEAKDAVLRSKIDADLKDKILNNLDQGNYTANTAGAGLAKNSIQTKICNFRICG